MCLFFVYVNFWFSTVNFYSNQTDSNQSSFFFFDVQRVCQWHLMQADRVPPKSPRRPQLLCVLHMWKMLTNAPLLGQC